MDDFIKKLGGDKKKTENRRRGGGISNPFSNFLVGERESKFSGKGQSLGGSNPGRILRVSLSNHGSLGVKVEKTQSGGAIVASVIPSTQASHAGLERGDIICIPNSDGEEEMHFEQFMALARSDRRPLVFDVRRIQLSSKKNATIPTTKKSPSSSSAAAHVRKQAVIAAAEAREREHKTKIKRINKTSSTVDSSKLLSKSDRIKLESEQKSRLEDLKKQGPQSEESRVAIMRAKKDEALTTRQLGFNLYETKKLTGEQARTATVDMMHGSVDAGDLHSTGIKKGKSTETSKMSAKHDSSSTKSSSPKSISVHESFDEVFSMFLSSNENTYKSISTMHTLILNAITKGKLEGENNAKYRRIRLSNKKIHELLVNVHGAIDVMLIFGFVFQEEDDETYLIYPIDTIPPDWAMNGLDRMIQLQSKISS